MLWQDIHQLDQQISLTINSWNSAISDPIWAFLSMKLVWVPLYAAILALIIWKLFFINQETVPGKVLIISNISAALLFAAGHLPATYALLGELTPLVLFRCFLLNGGFGLLFGWLYRKYGIQYAMLSHAMLHIVSKLIWTIFA